MVDFARVVVPQQKAIPVRERLRSMEDADVVSAFLEGEERAFEELVDRYQGRLLNFVVRTIGDRDRAEDLVQEVFIRVYRHIGRFDRAKKFSTWIYTIASNLAKNELRNRARDVLLTQAIATEEGEEGVPTEDLKSLDGMTDELAAALAARGVCSREDLAEQSTEDLDGVGGLTEATAGKLIMAARAHWFTDGASA